MQKRFLQGKRFYNTHVIKTDDHTDEILKSFSKSSIMFTFWDRPNLAHREIVFNLLMSRLTWRFYFQFWMKAVLEQNIYSNGVYVRFFYSRNSFSLSFLVLQFTDLLIIFGENILAE